MYKDETKRKLYSWHTEAADGAVYSVDKVVLRFTLRHDCGQKLLDQLAACAPLVYDHWNSGKVGSYRDQFSFKTDTGGSFWLGLGLNTGGKREWLRGSMEWNPNKVGDTREFRFVYNSVVLWAKSCEVKQYDLAVDIPAARTACTLVKDGRLYEEVMYSAEDRTQYAGQRNAPGRVKLYNKTLEAGLSEPVTRMELTCAGADDPEAVAARWPKVVVLTGSGEAWEGMKLTDTDRFILRTLVEAPERLVELGRRLRKKYEPLLLSAGGYLEPDAAAIAACAAQVASLGKTLTNGERPVFARKWWDLYPREIGELTQAVEESE